MALHNLRLDPNETTELTAEHPALVADLEALMDASHEPSEAFPLPTVDGDVRRTE